MKEVAKYQQTFHGTTDDFVFSFAFYRIFKQQRTNKFRLRVTQIADFRAGSMTCIPHAYFADGLTNGTSTYSDETTAGTSGSKTNEFCLGIVVPLYMGGTAQTATSGGTSYSPAEVYLDDISISPFTVRYRHVGTDAYPSGNVGLLFSLEITEVSFDD